MYFDHTFRYHRSLGTLQLYPELQVEENQNKKSEPGVALPWLVGGVANCHHVLSFRPIMIAFGLILAIGYELGVLDSLQSTSPFLAGGDVRSVTAFDRCSRGNYACEFVRSGIGSNCPSSTALLRVSEDRVEIGNPRSVGNSIYILVHRQQHFLPDRLLDPISR